MKVYKFGGASVRNADGVQNLLKIIGDEQDLFIIVEYGISIAEVCKTIVDTVRYLSLIHI